MEINLNYQLGLLTAEYVIATQLPSLSTDSLPTNTVIQVNKPLTEEWNRRHQKWWKSNCNNDIFHDNLKWYKKEVEGKYLKDKVKVKIPTIQPTELENFKEGFSDAIWDCDRSHYIFDEFVEDLYLDVSYRRHLILKKN
jgi:hypothetical protein